MSDNSIRLIFAVPGALIAAALAFLISYTWWVALLLAVAMGAIAGYVIAAIVQERLRPNDDNGPGGPWGHESKRRMLCGTRLEMAPERPHSRPTR